MEDQHEFLFAAADCFSPLKKPEFLQDLGLIKGCRSSLWGKPMCYLKAFFDFLVSVWMLMP